MRWKDCKGLVAFVTGGSSGIGLAIAGELVRRGADVAILARDQARLEHAVWVLGAQRRSEKQRLVWSVCDVSDEGSVFHATSRLVRELGAPDLLVNAAGWAYIDYFMNVTPQRLRSLVETNLYGPYHMIQAVLPHMRGRGGTIVNVASVGGLVGYFGAAAYCASKFAVVGLSEALRNELACEGIRVAVLCPPNTATPGFDRENLTKPPETRAVEGTAGTYRAEQVARALMRGLARGRFVILCGYMSWLTHVMHRIAPRLVYAVMDADVRRARKRRTK